MDPDVGIPVKHNIPLRVLRELALHLDTGTEHTWESLAEYMNLDTVTISVRYFGSICFVVCLLSSAFCGA